MIAARPTSVRDVLHEAPRSLSVLSNEHKDGWGIAIESGGTWRIERRTACAARCADFAALARISASLVIAHVRKATVGRLAVANTHPFRHAELVFAHNGTVERIGALVGRTAPEHLALVDGETDSERLFAFLRTQIAEAGDVERGIARGVAVMQSIPDLGAATFLMSCGSRLYAYRSGRTLFTRLRGDVSMVASEPLTNESWVEVPEHRLVIVDRPRTSSEHPLAA